MKFSAFLLSFASLFLIQNPLMAKDVKIGIGLALEPYVFTDKSEGIEIDIVREALKFKGHNLVPVYYPLTRAMESLKDEKLGLDGGMTLPKSVPLTNITLCDEHIAYQNVGISLKEKNLKVDTLAELQGKSIIAFQTAKEKLGEDFRKAVEGNKNYEEFPFKENQIKMLYTKRVDLIVLEKNIFEYVKNKLTDIDHSLPIAIHEFLPKTRYFMGFKDPKLCEDFNAGLADLKKSGRYDEIFKKYLQRK